MRLCVYALVLAGSPVFGAQWVTLDTEGIKSALTSRMLQYENAVQTFMPSGKTLYEAGTSSWGNWRADRDQYCSEWPPADGWTCYDLERSGDGRQIRFVDERGGATVGKYIDLN